VRHQRTFGQSGAPAALGLERFVHSMAKVLVLYYSTYGHIEQMANAMAEGARAAGAEVVIKRVPETVPEEVAKNGHFKLDQQAPRRHRRRAARLRRHHHRRPDPLRPHAFADGGLPRPDRRPVGARRAARQGRRRLHLDRTQHGGQETTLFSIITNLLHFGMVVVGLPYSFAGQMTLDEITGGSPYGASTIAGGQGQRQPSQNELDGARHQGELVAKTAAKLFG
jgi:NAD(P)H dehydrogenase (quinone)